MKKTSVALTFIVITGFLSIASEAAVESTQANADQVFVNGGVYTMNQSMPWAEAVAIQDGIVVAVGGNSEISEYIGDEVCIIGDPQEVREKVIERYDGLADSLYFYAFHDYFPTRRDEVEGSKVEQNLLRVIDAFKDFK